MNISRGLGAGQKKSLCDYLKDTLEYSPNMIRQTIKCVEEMEPETKRMLFAYLYDNQFPPNEIEGVTAEELVEKVKMNPISAFLALDYLVKDPEAAKYILTQRPEIRDTDEKRMEKLYADLKNELELKKLGRTSLSNIELMSARADKGYKNDNKKEFAGKEE